MDLPNFQRRHPRDDGDPLSSVRTWGSRFLGNDRGGGAGDQLLTTT